MVGKSLLVKSLKLTSVIFLLFQVLSKVNSSFKIRRALLILWIYRKRKFYSMSFFGSGLATALWFDLLIYNDKQSIFHELLKKIIPFLFILETCNFLLRKCIKLAKGISLTIMREVCRFRNSRRYNLRQRQSSFQILFRNSVYNGKANILCQIT